MDQNRFDDLAKVCSGGISRRRTVTGLAGGALSVLLGGLGAEDAAAACVRINRKCRKGKRCCAGGTCQSGKCRCGARLTPCAGRCVDAHVDPDNCGNCGEACAPGQACADGICQVTEHCPVSATNNEQLDAARRMETTATLNCDGLLEVVTWSQNGWAFEGLRGRVRVRAYDAAGNTWTSQLFQCTTRCGTLDPSCGPSGTNRFVDQAPAEFARRAERLEIFHANNRDPLS